MSCDVLVETRVLSRLPNSFTAWWFHPPKKMGDARHWWSLVINGDHIPNTLENKNWFKVIFKVINGDQWWSMVINGDHIPTTSHLGGKPPPFFVRDAEKVRSDRCSTKWIHRWNRDGLNCKMGYTCHFDTVKLCWTSGWRKTRKLAHLTYLAKLLLPLSEFFFG